MRRISDHTLTIIIRQQHLVSKVVLRRFTNPHGELLDINVQTGRTRRLHPSASMYEIDYISAAPNPKAALALVNRLESFLHFTLDTTELRAATVDFEKKVAQAVAENPNMAAYVRQLEERDREEGLEIETAPKGNGGNGHANGKDLEEDLQRFLRQRKDKKEDE